MSLPERDARPHRRGERLVGRVLQDLVVTAAVWVVLGGVAGGVLALMGLWQPLVAGTVLLVLLAVSWRVAHALPATALPVGAALALVAVALAGAVWAGATHSEQVLPRRDSASYLQSAIDLASHHERPIDIDVEAIGGPDVVRMDGISLASPAFYETGSPTDPTVQPQFMVGPSVWWSVAIWVGGLTAAFLAPAVVMALGVLALGLLTARVLGAWWATAASALVFACFPVLHTARSTYSETLASLVLAAGMLCLVVAADSDGRTSPRGATLRARYAGGLAGALVGGGAVLRPDALRETLLVVLVAGLALVARRPHGRPLVVGALAGTAVTFALALATSWQYLATIAGSLVPLAALTLVVLVAVGLVVRTSARGRRLRSGIRSRLALLLPALVVLTGVALATRPLWLVTRQSPDDPGARYVAVLQAQQGLVVDGGRTYAEDTVTWLQWWVGPAALVLALVALAVAVHRMASAWAADRPLPSWSGPLLVAAGSTLLTLLRPGITPDHPWADRRLLIALPLVLVLAVAAMAAVSRWLAARSRLAAVAATVVLGVSVAGPVAWATSHHATERVEQGELAAVRRVCEATGPGDVALAVDDRAANEWVQVLRGMCGVPTLSTTHALRTDTGRLAETVARVAAEVEEAGGRLLLVAADSPDVLAEVGATGVHQVVGTTVLEDPRLLEQRPDDLVELPVRVWFGRPPAPGE